jgi:N-acyl-D-aspartate/D-glutamate deacylase
MCALVREAMAAGAIGFSSSQAPTHVGARGLPVPSRLASTDELRRLLGTVAASGTGLAEITYGPQFAIEEVALLSKELGLRITWGSLLTNLFGGRGAAMEMLERASAIGGDIWPQVSSRFITLLIHLQESMLFFQMVPAWKDAINASPGEREAMYRDPAWRDRARAEVHRTDIPGWKPERWERIWVDETVKHAAVRGRLIHELAAERGTDPMDVMLDLALDENLETRFRVATTNVDPVELRQLLTDSRTVMGAHDAGAHVDVLCDACYPSWVLEHWVRQERAMTLEQAVHKLSGQPAAIFRLDDRGRIAPGLVADLVALDPETVGAGHNERVWDFPANGDRLVSRNVGTYHVWVNGEQIRRDGVDVDGAAPGRMVSPHPA